MPSLGAFDPKPVRVRVTNWITWLRNATVAIKIAESAFMMPPCAQLSQAMRIMTNTKSGGPILFQILRFAVCSSPSKCSLVSTLSIHLDTFRDASFGYGSMMISPRSRKRVTA